MVKYIFIDESGDLGIKKSSSRWFLFAAVITSDERALERVIKKIWKSLKRKHKRRGELHAYHDNDQIRRKLLKAINNTKDIRIALLLVDKTRLRKDSLKYEIIANILVKKVQHIISPEGDKSIQYTFDKKNPSITAQENFIKYIADSTDIPGDTDLSISLKSSHENKSIQAVDFIAWATFRKYEKGDQTFFNLFKDKVIVEITFP